MEQKRDLKQEYDNMIKNNKVFLFMKGTPTEPMCGFSLRVINLLSELDVEFESYNILDDIEMRQAVKQFANWPTYPQLYVNADLIGGCEIIEELYRNGELNEILDLKE